MIKSTNIENIDLQHTSLEDSLDQLEDSSTQHELSSNPGEVNILAGLGLSDEALDEAIQYFSSAAPAPKYMEGFSNEKLKNFTTVATVAQVARVPGLIKLLNEANTLLFSSNELQKMDMNDLTKLSKSLSEEIRLILDGARRTLDTLDKLDAPASPNQQLLEKLLQMPDDEIRAMQEYLKGKRGES